MLPHLAEGDKVSIHKLQPLIIHHSHQGRAVVADRGDDACVRFLPVCIPHREQRPKVGEDIREDAPDLGPDECDGGAVTVAILIQLDGVFVGQVCDDDSLSKKSRRMNMIQWIGSNG
jgi:hypothetical protein